ncbi:hypothetical protein ACEN2J_03120 [Pseudorhodobacter sp. W20_MBD10_FR17]|uniref:hypothetical protein n=1 Tax=Pseudorhodobacter sp. W20_MBD10_FR17 TaxID=3240266 RepID=UPI003F9B7842
MGAVSIQQMAERVSVLLTERLHIKGRDLDDKLRRGGRLLPRKVRLAAQEIATAKQQSFNPKLLLQINQETLAENYDICIKHLNAVNKGHRLRGVLLGLSTSILFSLLAVAALALGFLVWRGFL